MSKPGSGHFHGANGKGGGTSNQTVNSLTNKLPTNDSQIKHIFRPTEGHLSDTPENRKLIETTANNPENYKVDILPTHKCGGFRYQQPKLLMKAKSDKVSCAGRCPALFFFLYADRNIRVPSFKIFFAAFVSLSWYAPHFGQRHSRTLKSFVSGFFSPHSEHS